MNRQFFTASIFGGEDENIGGVGYFDSLYPNVLNAPGDGGKNSLLYFCKKL